MIFPPPPENQQLVSRSLYCEETQQLQEGIAENQVKTQALEKKIEIMKEQNRDLRKQLQNQRTSMLHKQKKMLKHVESLVEKQDDRDQLLLNEKLRINQEVQRLGATAHDQQMKIHDVENQLAEAAVMQNQREEYQRQQFKELGNELAILQDVKRRVDQNGKLMQEVGNEVSQQKLHLHGIDQKFTALQEETEDLHEIVRTHESKINALATGFRELMRRMEQKMLGWVVNHNLIRKK
ncbi:MULTISPECIES: hypothetical protein [Sporosarcina]|uniref:Uncharacterized protein n=1 Tax=Sporosarcina newyorkensis TaxID=759851 RepID=A0A1T4XSI4_9BACL|nr:hypothetical protein [Sporosarcina newyorkensis]SKA92522.1 hypothetical protein SAMN04244570_1315 [Sporosarcina newyorkensis]